MKIVCKDGAYLSGFRNCSCSPGELLSSLAWLTVLTPDHPNGLRGSGGLVPGSFGLPDTVSVPILDWAGVTIPSSI